MTVQSRMYKPILDKLIELMDAHTDADSDEVFTVGSKKAEKPFRKRFPQPRKSIPIGHFPCYFYYVSGAELNWSSFPKNVMGNVHVRVVFYKQVFDTDNVEQTHDLYFWAEELGWLVTNNQRWDGACSDGVQKSEMGDIAFDFVAEGGHLFMLADCRLDFFLKIDMT